MATRTTFKKGEKKRKQGERGPGKITLAVKDAIAKAADDLGGPDRLVAWCKEDPANERVFWGTIYPKLLPLQLTGEGGGPVQARLTVEFVNSTSKRV